MEAIGMEAGMTVNAEPVLRQGHVGAALLGVG